MRRLIFQLIQIGFFIAMFAGALFYVHTHWMSYERVGCDPNNVPPGQICIKTILEMWKDKVLWVDARTQDAFERSMYLDEAGLPRLGEARVVPLRNDSTGMELLSEAMPALLEASDKRMAIVVFCDKSCASATEVADLLRSPDLGIESPIYVLYGGWDTLRREPIYMEKNKL